LYSCGMVSDVAGDAVSGTGSATGRIHAARAVHVGRQAVYDRDGAVAAYELLFRHAGEAVEAAERDSGATSRVIVAAFTDFSIDELAGDRACFVNVTREFLTGELPLPLDPGRVGLEIPVGVVADDAVLAGIAGLVDEGYTIVLDRFVPGQDRDALLEYASYVKIDLLDGNFARVRATVAHCRRQWPHVQLIGQRIEQQATLVVATNLGFDLFQGHALGRPHVASIGAVDPGRLSRLQLLTELAGEELDVDRIVSLIEADPALAVRVLRMVNATATGLRRTVTSISDAVVLLGPATIRQWVVLMLTAGLADAAGGDEARLQDAVTYARLCRNLADHHAGQHGGRHQVSPDSAYTAGLLVMIADMLGLSAADLAAQLPLSDDLTEALITGTGPLGVVLAAMDDYRQGRMPRDVPDAAERYLAALRWSAEALQRAGVSNRLD
jgi:c-di-GMP-related signal transduction protein